MRSFDSVYLHNINYSTHDHFHLPLFVVESDSLRVLLSREKIDEFFHQEIYPEIISVRNELLHF